MEIKRNEMKMYYKRQDLENSYFNKKKLIVTDNIYVIVAVLGLDGKTFACNVYQDNRLVNVKCFYSVGCFNDFVKWQRWISQ